MATKPNQVAPMFFRAAAKAKVRIPQDISVVGFGDRSFAKHMYPTLTTLRQDPEEIGRSAADVLLERISGKTGDEGPTEIRLEPHLVVRESTAELGKAWEV